MNIDNRDIVKSFEDKTFIPTSRYSPSLDNGIKAVLDVSRGYPITKIENYQGSTGLATIFTTATGKITRIIGISLAYHNEDPAALDVYVTGTLKDSSASAARLAALSTGVLIGGSDSGQIYVSFPDGIILTEGSAVTIGATGAAITRANVCIYISEEAKN